MDSHKKQIVEAFNGLRADNLQILDGFYAPDVVFEDPLGKVKGLDQMKAYYANLYKNVRSIHFDFSEMLGEGPVYAAVWTMTMEVKNLNGGRPIEVKGMSHFRFNEKDRVAFHRDYFDMGEMVYEHVPLLKYFVVLVKKQLG